MKQKIASLVFGLVIILGLILWYTAHAPSIEPTPEVAEVLTPPPAPLFSQAVIGRSVEGRVIERFTFGTGSTTLLFVGGVHGGYEWNSIVLAYEFINALKNKTIVIPEALSVVIVPNLNPDGLYAATGKEGEVVAGDITSTAMHATGLGRFNANNVDLNRNFACKWQPESTWRNQAVSAGSAPFSEPEAVALRSVVEQVQPKAAIFWHSQANTVYASECEDGILPQTLTLMETYASAANYNTVESFDAYPVTGDAEGWLAARGVPAITVELASRTDSEWPQNRLGIEAVLKHYEAGE